MTKLLFSMKFKLYKMNYFKLLFFFILIFSTMFTINSSSWLNSWMGLEMNLLSFIPLMIYSNKINKISNSMMIYFMIQASSSSILLMFIMMLKTNNNLENFMFKMMIQLSILMKMGAYPFYWWTPKIIINLNWMNTLIFLTWQKFAPMFLLMMTNFNNMIYISMIMSIFYGTMLGLNQSMIKLILMYSSLNQMGWIMMIMFLNNLMMKLFLLIYSLNIMLICFSMNFFKINFINQLMYNNNKNMNTKIINMSLLFSLSGLPPFLGFLPKMFTLIILMKNSLYFELMLLIIMSTISLSFYMNMMISMFLLKKNNMKWNNNFYNLNYMMINNIIMNMLISMMLLMFFFNNMF